MLRLTRISQRSGIGSVLGNSRHIVEKIGFGVAAEIADAHFRVGQVRRKSADVVGPLIDNPHQAISISGVSATLVARGTLEHQYTAALLTGRKRGTKRCVAAADHDDIERLCPASFISIQSPTISGQATAADPI